MRITKRLATVVAALAFSLGAVRYYRLEMARSAAGRAVSEFGGRMTSLTPPIPLLGSEYYIIFEDQIFSPEELDRLLSALKSLTERNYVMLKFDNPPLSAEQQLRIEQRLPAVHIYRDRPVSAPN